MKNRPGILPWKKRWAWKCLWVLLVLYGSQVFVRAQEEVLTTEHFKIFYAPGTEKIGRHVQAQAEAALQYVSQSIGIAPPARIFVQIMPRDGGDPARRDPQLDWVAGLAVSAKNLIMIMTHHLGTARAKEVRTILLHEISHLLVGHKNPEQDPAVCPRWFDEGVAMLIAHEWRVADSVFLAKIIATDSHLSLGALSSTFPANEAAARTAYLESASFVSYLNNRYGRETLKQIIREMGPGQSFHSLIREITGTGLAELEEDWLGGLRLKYKWIPLIFGSFSIWTLITALFLVGYLRKKKKMKEIEASWHEEHGYHDSDPF